MAHAPVVNAKENYGVLLVVRAATFRFETHIFISFPVGVEHRRFLFSGELAPD